MLLKLTPSTPNSPPQKKRGCFQFCSFRNTVFNQKPPFHIVSKFRNSTNRQTDIATYRLILSRGRLGEKNSIFLQAMYGTLVFGLIFQVCSHFTPISLLTPLLLVMMTTPHNRYRHDINAMST